jgi:hypothetical protein
MQGVFLKQKYALNEGTKILKNIPMVILVVAVAMRHLCG